MLNDKKIKQYINDGKIKIEPFDESLVGPASIDVRLGFKFRVFKNTNTEVLDVKNYEDEPIFRERTKDYTIHVGRYSDLYIFDSPEKGFVIHPGEFILASIYEYIELPDNIAAQIHGRSSIGRLGLFVHTSAGWIDPGYKGHLTLEIYNVNKIPIKVYPLMKIAQIVFFEIESVEVPYNLRKGSKYVDEEGAQYSKITEDYK